MIALGGLTDVLGQLGVAALVVLACLAAVCWMAARRQADAAVHVAPDDGGPADDPIGIEGGFGATLPWEALMVPTHAPSTLFAFPFAFPWTDLQTASSPSDAIGPATRVAGEPPRWIVAIARLMMQPGVTVSPTQRPNTGRIGSAALCHTFGPAP